LGVSETDGKPRTARSVAGTRTAVRTERRVGPAADDAELDRLVEIIEEQLDSFIRLLEPRSGAEAGPEREEGRPAAPG